MTEAARLRITLMDLEPAPWREIEVPLSMSFKGLHDAIQAAFLWFDMHLWEFDVEGRRYGLPLDDDFGGERVYKASVARLTKLCDTGTKSFLYTYDMGDNWEHRIDVLELFTADSDALLPHFVAGQWRAPPEDVGGPPGFEAFLEAIRDPDHPERTELLDWYGGPFDPENIDEDVIRIQFDRLAKARIRKR